MEKKILYVLKIDIFMLKQFHEILVFWLNNYRDHLVQTKIGTSKKSLYKFE